MKRLLLMRHAEASSDAVSDLDRPLSDRGAAAARFIGRTVAERGLFPQQVISSHAARALQTASILKESAGPEIEVTLDERIYDAVPQTLLELAAGLSNEIESLLMVGHNPGFEGFISFLTGVVQPLRAGSLAMIELRIDRWHDLDHCCGDQTELFDP